jgi:outer membrane protein
MRTPWLLVSVLILMIQAAAPSQEVQLEAGDLPRLIQEKNQNVTGARLLSEAAQHRTGHLARSFLPNLGLQGGAERFITGTSERAETQPYALAEANLNIFRGGRDALEEEIRKAQVQMTSALERGTYAAELKDARDEYWVLIHKKELREALKESLELSQKNLSSANRRIERGLAPETDRLEFEIKLAQLNEAIDQTSHEIILSEARLRALLGMAPEAKINTSDLIPVESKEELPLRNYDPNLHPDVVSLKTSQSMALNQHRRAERWWLPSVDLYSQYALYTEREREFSSMRDRDDYAVGIRFTLNLFDGMQAKSEARAYAMETEAYQNQAAQRARTVLTQFETTQRELKNIAKLIQQAEKRIIVGRDFLNRSLEDYDRGVRNSLDILSAAELYFSLRQRAMELKRDYQFTKAELLMYLGE